jgi:hypothetical protein
LEIPQGSLFVLRILSSLLSLFIIEFPFGRDKFSLDEMLPGVAAVFRRLHVKYHHRVRKEYVEKLDTISNPTVLRELLHEWTCLGYSDEALGLIAMRTIDLARDSGIPIVMTDPGAHLACVSTMFRQMLINILRIASCFAL